MLKLMGMKIFIVLRSKILSKLMRDSCNINIISILSAIAHPLALGKGIAYIGLDKQTF